MTDELILRQFQTNDQPAARQLILSGLAERWGKLNPAFNDDLDDIASRYGDGVFLVALRGDELVGTGALIHESEGVARIVRMSVAAPLRRHGLGKRICDELCARARTRGYRRIVLETTETWLDAIRFYEQCGFRRQGASGGDEHFVLEL